MIPSRTAENCSRLCACCSCRTRPASTWPWSTVTEVTLVTRPRAETYIRTSCAACLEGNRMYTKCTYARVLHVNLLPARRSGGRSSRKMQSTSLLPLSLSWSHGLMRCPQVRELGPVGVLGISICIPTCSSVPWVFESGHQRRRYR